MVLTAPSTDTRQILADIVESLRHRFASLNRHYQAGWTDSFVHYRCWHEHPTLLDAAKCAESQRVCGAYVFAVDFGVPRELTAVEDEQVRVFRLHSRPEYISALRCLGG